MIKIFSSVLLIVILIVGSETFANDSKGIIKIKSSYDVTETVNRLETSLKNKGMTIFTRIDHSSGAQKAGLQIPPTELIIFGKPKIGTRLILQSPTAALDLPQKALVFEDTHGQVWLAYNDPVYIARRHNIKSCLKIIHKITNALEQHAISATN